MISRDNRNAYAEERQPQMYDSILNGCFCSCICRSYIETVLAVGRCFYRDEFYACTWALGKYVAWHHNYAMC